MIDGVFLFPEAAMPTVSLSDSALALLRAHVEQGGELTDNDSNRTACRELAAAGLMIPGHSFTRGREAFYVLTEVGRKFSGIHNAPWHAESGSPRPSWEAGTLTPL